MSTIEEIQQEIIEEFSLFDDWMEKYQYIIDSGKTLSPLDAAYRTEELIIKGCQSQVWLRPIVKVDQVLFEADSDAAIVKGLISLLVRVMSGQKVGEVAKADLHFIDDIGMREHLSMTRSNGLSQMIKQMKNYAVVLERQSSN
ncbi:MAG: cysteine desulfuration protein SufE [Sphingobacteriales bacterium]